MDRSTPARFSWAATLALAAYVAKTDGSEVWEVPNTQDGYDPAWRPE